MADLFEDEEISALSWKMIQSDHWKKNCKVDRKGKNKYKALFEMIKKSHEDTTTYLKAHQERMKAHEEKMTDHEERIKVREEWMKDYEEWMNAHEENMEARKITILELNK